MHKRMKKSPYKIAQSLKMNEQTGHNIIEKYKETGTVHDLPKSGRKRKLSNKQVQQVVRKAKEGKTSPQIARECETEVSPRTIRRRPHVIWACLTYSLITLSACSCHARVGVAPG